MTEEVTRALVFGGLPETGKTSYLALLYLAITGGRTTELKLGGYQDDREHVNQIAGRLLRVEEPNRTSVDSEGELVLSLSAGAPGDQVLLRIPDLSGEMWEHALADRRWNNELEERIRKSQGACLFLHVTKCHADATIAEVDRAEDALASDSDRGVETKPEIVAGAAGIEESGAVARSAAQVELVDLLQLVCEERGKRPARTSIVLSAWDLLPEGLTPDAWISENCPLVRQYLDSNADWLLSQVWGVSAQGGSYDTAEDRAHWSQQDVVDRAKVLRGDGSPGSVEDPVLWVLGR